MPTTVAYAIALAEARSCLAALDAAASFEEPSHFARLLLNPDGMHDDEGFPELYPTAGQPAELLRRLEAAVERLLDLGGDGLSLEPLLADAVVR